MSKRDITEAIDDRLEKRWRKRCHDESAVPICVVAIKQLAGHGAGTPMLCTLEDMDNALLADFLEGLARQLRQEAG